MADDTNGGFPRWILWGGLALVVIVLLLNRSTSSGNATPTVTPIGSDPNTEATNQARLASQTSAFGALVSGVTNLSADRVNAVRDINISALNAGASVANTMASEAGATARARYALDAVIAEQGGLTSRASIAESGATMRAQIDSATSLGQADYAYRSSTALATIQSELSKYLGDISLQETLDTNRSALSASLAQTAAQRQKNTNDAIANVSKTIGSVACKIFTLGFGRC